jgi:hypothetical protein
MFVSETYSSAADQNDQKCFVKVNNVQKHDLDSSMKEAEKGQMSMEPKREPNLPETFSSADQNYQKNLVQANVFEEILETKEIEIKEELLDDVAAAEDDPLAIVKQEPF